MARFHEPKIAYARDPILLWVALVTFFALLVVIFGLTVGNAIAVRRAAMVDFVNSYQLASAQDQLRDRQVRVILAQ